MGNNIQMIGIGTQEILCLMVCLISFVAPLVVAIILVRRMNKNQNQEQRDYDDQP